MIQLFNDDCFKTLQELSDNSVDSIVTDPPYGLTSNKKGGSGVASVDLASPYGRSRIGTGNGQGGFMGLKWDSDVPPVEVWAECLRVLKPGGHLLAFAGTRTQHRMAVRIEDAGFEIRDMIAWVYGSGFPKSLDVSKAIDKSAGAEREVVGNDTKARSTTNGSALPSVGGATVYRTWNITAPATDAARQWQGWGTALKPALEPITVARKPLAGTVAANVLEWGTGAINVDGCRVGSDGGRWPANLIHDGSDEVLRLFPWQKSGARAEGVRTGLGSERSLPSTSQGDGGAAIEASEGSAARFFYCAKASKRDRDEGLEGLPEKLTRRYGEQGRGPSAQQTPGQDVAQRNIHPTVKPTDLMRYLCRLVTPPGGVVLDPFMGSGSTGKAAMLEGFRFIGIEREPSYMEIAKARIYSAAGIPEWLR